MPGHNFEDRQRKAGYDSFSREAVDSTPAPGPAGMTNREFNETLEATQREREQRRGTPLAGEDSRKDTVEQRRNIMETFEDPNQILKDAQQIRQTVDPSRTGIFGVNTGNLPAIGPFLGTIQGLNSTNIFFQNLANKGAAGLNTQDKVTLVNLINRLGTSPESFEDLIETYADKNDVTANSLFANFNKAYSDIQSNVAQSGVSEYFNRIGEIGETDDNLKTMFGDLTGTRDTEGIVTLEKVTDNLGTEGLQFLKVTNPQAYYRLRPNDPDLANESFVSTNDRVADRRFNAKIMEARALANDARSREAQNMGQGIIAASPALPGLPFQPPSQPIDMKKPIPPIVPPVPMGTGITPFNVNQFYASLPQYTQQGIMSPNLAQFNQNLRMFPGMA